MAAVKVLFCSFFLISVHCTVQLKGQCHKIFFFRFFAWITFPQAPDNNIRIISNFFENSRRYSQVKVHHWCQWHRWQIAANINDTSGKFATGINYTGGKFCHQFPLCCWHRWQIIGTISGCRHLNVNLKAKIYKYVSSTTQRWPNKSIKIFLIEDFFHLPPVSLTPIANLELQISPRIFEKIWNGLYEILWGWGETDSWKNQKQKISWHCPFKWCTSVADPDLGSSALFLAPGFEIWDPW